jgi:Ulp1 family protease
VAFPSSVGAPSRAAWQVEADRRAHDKIGNSNLVVLVFPNLRDKGALTVTDEEVQRLVQNEYLNDTLIDYQLKQIQASLSPALLERCHF